MPGKSSKSKRNTYHAHRLRQRRRILSAAGKLFDERGIDRTTMAEVISASELRASTIYEYFRNKDEIVWAILSEVFEETAAGAKKAVEGATTGLARITALLEYMADELTENQARIRFLAQRLLMLEGQIHAQGFEVFRNLILEGIADGSLRRDLDPDLTMHAVMNAVIGAQRRLASLGTKVELEYGHPIDRLFRETIRIIVFGLRATEHVDTDKTSARVRAPKKTTKKRFS